MRNQFLDSIIRNGSTFTFDEAIRNSNITRESLYVLLHRMENDGIIERVERGAYIIIPRGTEKGKFSPHEFLIGKLLIDPSVISFWSALNYHGLTEQIPSTVFIQSTKRKKNSNPQVFGITYRIITVDERKLFGLKNIWIEQEKVKITDVEKTIVDCLHRPDLCGGIIEVAKGLRERTFDRERIADYALKMENTGVIRRLGYLSDLMDLGIPLDPIDTRNYLSLDPTMPESIRRSSKWRLIANLEDEDLFGE